MYTQASHSCAEPAVALISNQGAMKGFSGLLESLLSAVRPSARPRLEHCLVALAPLTHQAEVCTGQITHTSVGGMTALGTVGRW